jgi:hypothetical protein
MVDNINSTIAVLYSKEQKCWHKESLIEYIRSNQRFLKKEQKVQQYRLVEVFDSQDEADNYIAKNYSKFNVKSKWFVSGSKNIRVTIDEETINFFSRKFVTPDFYWLPISTFTNSAEKTQQDLLKKIWYTKEMNEFICSSLGIEMFEKKQRPVYAIVESIKRTRNNLELINKIEKICVCGEKEFRTERLDEILIDTYSYLISIDKSKLFQFIQSIEDYKGEFTLSVNCSFQKDELIIKDALKYALEEQNEGSFTIKNII